MERFVRWMKILRYIQSNDGVATQRSIVKATGVGVSIVCQDLRQLGMWYHRYVKNEGRPKMYSLLDNGHAVVHGMRPLFISDRTRSR